MSKKRKTPMSRSENMARIKSSNTKPEVYIRKLLHRRGLRYRINYRKLPGSPDMFFPKHKTAVFVNGCFWHRHTECKYSTVPKSNTEFWMSKFKRNIERDRENYVKLKDSGIKIVVVWECTIKEMIRDCEKEQFFIERIADSVINSDDSFKEY